jgi:hypothetical protein
VNGTSNWAREAAFFYGCPVSDTPDGALYIAYGLIRNCVGGTVVYTSQPLLEVAHVDFIDNLRESSGPQRAGILSSDSIGALKATACHFIVPAVSNALAPFDMDSSTLPKPPSFYIVTGCTFSGDVQDEAWAADNLVNVAISEYQPAADPKCARLSLGFSPSSVLQQTDGFYDGSDGFESQRFVPSYTLLVPSRTATPARTPPPSESRQPGVRLR